MIVYVWIGQFPWRIYLLIVAIQMRDIDINC